MTILVCDDDKEIVEAIEIYLLQEGFSVEKAYDGEQALEILKKKSIGRQKRRSRLYPTAVRMPSTVTAAASRAQ